MICPYCGNQGIKKGYRKSERNNQRIARKYRCSSCERMYSIPIETVVKSLPIPNILLLDIETAPMEVYVWGLYKQRIPHNNIIKDWFMLSWSAKWLYDDNVMSAVVTPKDALKRHDGGILSELWALLDKADIVIGHNLDRYDDRKIKARFLDNGMQPPTPYRTVDTLKVARREFALSSYKQDYITKHFKLHEKIDTSALGGFDLWKRCVNGDADALQLMVSYNRQDVRGLEDVYLMLRPYIKNHPNLGVMMDETVCPNCGSDGLIDTDSYYHTTANKFKVFRCCNCQTPYIRYKRNANIEQTDVRSVPK